MEYMLASTEKYNFFSIPKSRDLGFANPGIRDWEKRLESRDSGSLDYNSFHCPIQPHILLPPLQCFLYASIRSGTLFYISTAGMQWRF